MPKKTTILIILLAVVTALLIIVALTSETTRNLIPLPNGDNKIQQTTEAPTPKASLYFQPSTLTATTNGQQSVNILVDSAGMGVFGAQIELQYDPRAISNVNIVPAQNNFFGNQPTVILDSVDPTQGRASFAIGANIDGGDKIGTGVVATLTFTPNVFSGLSTTQIIFLPKTTVTSLQYPDYSILKDSTSLTVTLSGTSSAQVAPTISQ